MSEHEFTNVDFESSVFDMSSIDVRHKAWLWWFWLFFFENPKNPGKPRQLMILWSTKDVEQVDCNGLDIRFRKNRWDNPLDGVVAAWYFDGQKMHHNIVLEQCDIDLGKNSLTTKSDTPTQFNVSKDDSEVRIGDRFVFKMKRVGDHPFEKTTYLKDTVVSDYSYSLLRQNRAVLEATVDGETSKGTAYFQRVVVNAPIPPWYWGIYHFENGQVLTYYQPYILGKKLRGDIFLFDGENVNIFWKMDVKRLGGELPRFRVTGENETHRVSFTANAYSHSSWTFKSKPLKVLNSKLVYNEYPSTITDFELEGEEKTLTCRDFGKAMGNAEHSTGILL